MAMGRTNKRGVESRIGWTLLEQEKWTPFRHGQAMWEKMKLRQEVMM